MLSSPRCEFDDALFFGRFPKSIEKIARLREVVGYRHVRWDSSDTSDVLTRARRNFADNSDKQIQIENKQDSDMPAKIIKKYLHKKTRRNNISTLRTMKKKIIAINGCLKRVKNPFWEG